LFGVLAVGFTSCQEADFSVSDSVYQNRGYESAFAREFGAPSADQSWDFYAEKMESVNLNTDVTRATQSENIAYSDLIPQPMSASENIDKWKDYLPEGQDNRDQGQNEFTLTSSGTFTVSVVNYGGVYETDSQYDFELGIEAYVQKTGILGITYWEWERQALFSTGSWNNPGFAREVTIAEGTPIRFYLKHSHTLLTYTYNTTDIPGLSGWIRRFDSAGTLLYSDEIGDEKVMIIGMEDKWQAFQEKDFDFNDVVLYITGDLPVSSPKRFMCEDLSSFDFDYNDVVIDVQSGGVVLRAVGGTLPVYLEITNGKGETHRTGELHEVMKGEENVDVTFTMGGKTYYKPINVGADNGITLPAVRFIEWTGGERIDDLTNYTGVKLFVAPEYGASAEELTEVSWGTPAVIACPIETSWLKEMKSIKLGYPDFYNAGWYENEVPEYLYQINQ